jgi:hypothetical protein
MAATTPSDYDKMIRLKKMEQSMENDTKKKQDLSTKIKELELRKQIKQLKMR